MNSKKILAYFCAAAFAEATFSMDGRFLASEINNTDLMQAIDSVTLISSLPTTTDSLAAFLNFGEKPTSSSDTSLAMHSSYSSDSDTCVSVSTNVGPSLSMLNLADDDEQGDNAELRQYTTVDQRQRASMLMEAIQNEAAQQNVEIQPAQVSRIELSPRVTGGRPSFTMATKLAVHQQNNEPHEKIPFPRLCQRTELPMHRSVLSTQHSDSASWANDKSLTITKPIIITNGSLLGFCGVGVVSQSIRLQTKQDNPLGFSHVGIALTATPSEIERLIELSTRIGGLHFNQKSKKVKESQQYMINMAKKLAQHTQSVFCLHSTGRYGVHLVPLQAIVAAYSGCIYLRKLIMPIPLTSMLEAIARDLGKKYNSSLRDLQHCTTDKNVKADNIREFCSQLVACIYQECSIIPSEIVSTNVTPAEFSSHCADDLLAHVALREELLKICDANECCRVM